MVVEKLTKSSQLLEVGFTASGTQGTEAQRQMLLEHSHHRLAIDRGMEGPAWQQYLLLNPKVKPALRIPEGEKGAAGSIHVGRLAKLLRREQPL